MITGLVTSGLLGQGLATGGLIGTAATPLLCYVDPLTVTRDNTLDDAKFGSVDPMAVARDNTKDDAIFGTIDPFRVTRA